MAHLDLDELAGDVGAIRAIALDVLGDPAGAEDVVQETLVATWQRGALESQAGDSGIERLRAWMRRCAKNAALQRLRGARRRRSREERAASPEAQASAEDALDRVALQRRVAAAVEALRSPDREIVALRYWDGLPPKEIARRLGLTPNAVSTRLARAKARLRADLEEEQPSSGASWAVVAAGWPSHPAPTAPPFPLRWIPAGTLAVKKTAVTAAGCLAAVAALVWLPDLVFVERDTAPTADANRIAELAAVGEDPMVVVEEGDTARSAPEVPTSTLPVPPAPAGTAAPAIVPTTGAVAVEVTDGSTGEPEPGIGLHLFVSSTLTWHDSVRAVTDSEGAALFEGVPRGRAVVYIHRPSAPNVFGSEWVEVVAGETAEVRFSVAPGTTVRGVVRDAAGRPVPRADIWLNDGAGAPHRGDIVAVTDEDGRYELDHVSTIQCVAARAAGNEPSRTRMVRFGEEEGDDLRVDIVLPALGGAIEGVVVDESGAPVPGAMVVIGWSGRLDHRKDGDAPSWGAPFLAMRADADGRFRTDRMGAGTIPVMARAASSGLARESALVPVGGTAEVVLRLEAPAVLHGVVRTDRGTPVSDATLSSATGLDVLTRFDARADEEGRFEIASLSSGEVLVEVNSDLERSSIVETLELRPGERREWNPVLATSSSLSGRVVSDAGPPLAGWHVRRKAQGDVGGRASGSTRTDADGRFTLDGCADVPHDLTVHPPGRLFSSPAAKLEGVTPSDDPPTLTVPADAIPTASVSGLVVDQDDAPRSVTFSFENLEIDTFEDIVHLRVASDASGRLLVEHLHPGRYGLRVTSDDPETSLALDPIEVLDGQTYELGTIVLP